MRGRGGKSAGGVPTDLLVCFPSRAHLALMPKAITSPSRSIEAAKRRHRQHQLRAGSASTLSSPSPLFVGKAKHLSFEAEEPTSPKVTCAGKIKVTPLKPPRRRLDEEERRAWVSVVKGLDTGMKKDSWLETLGIKKDVMHVLHAVQGLRFSMRCFGDFRNATTDYSSEEKEEEEEEAAAAEEEKVDGDAARTILSKWFMILEEEEQTPTISYDEEKRDGPPPNALVLMRCRSAPAKKAWLDLEGKKMMKTEQGRVVLKSYSPDFTEAAKETWIVRGVDPFMARSKSCR